MSSAGHFAHTTRRPARRPFDIKNASIGAVNAAVDLPGQGHRQLKWQALHLRRPALREEPPGGPRRAASQRLQPP